MKMQDDPFSPITDIQSKFIRNKNEKDERRSNSTTYRMPNITNTYAAKTTQLYAPNESQRKIYRGLGEKFIQSKQPMGFIIFAGGFSSRANLDDNQCKQFHELTFEQLSIRVQQNKNNSSNYDSRNMFEQALTTINPKWNSVIYIICSRKNSEEVINMVEQKMNMDYPNVAVYVCFQHEENVLDCNGLQNVYVTKSDQKLKYPAGTGAFGKAEMYYSDDEKYTLKEHIIEITKPKLVYCMGTCNYLETGPDLQMIGLLTKQDLSCVFKCCPTKNFNPEMPQVSVRTAPGYDPAWLVMQYNNLKNLVLKQSTLKTYPVWMDNFVFNPRILNQKYNDTNKSELDYQFNERTLKSKNKQLSCFIAQQLISFAVLRDKEKSIGYACNDGQFLKTNKDIQNYLNQSRVIMKSVSVIQKKKA